jgi:L-ribulose-5-phosphate 3-epimerase
MINRRDFISQSIVATAGVLSAVNAQGKSREPNTYPVQSTNTTADDLAFKISIFSKNLHWLDYSAMASTAADLGFDGVDLTVRPLGHVLPERVTEDLPKAYDAVKKAGLKINSIVTAIESADDPLTEPILKTANALGIPIYRMGWLHYDDKKSIEENLKVFTSTFKKLEAINKKYEIQGTYQNHSGSYFGAPLWDLAQVLKEINAQWTGSQYDVYHATIEGANSWPLGLKLLTPYVKMITVKDFHWTMKNGKSTSESVPLGEGVVDYKNYFSLLKQYGIRGPISLHYEYPLGGADQGTKEITIPKEEILTAMKKDIVLLKQWLKDAALT